jgi:hypothetical protein
VSHEVETLRRWLSEDYPNEVEVLLPLCLTDSGRSPLYFDHPGFVWEVVRLKGVAPEVLDDLHCAYVYLSSYYFCVDSVIDGHPRTGAQGTDIDHAALHLGLLLTGSLLRTGRALDLAFPDLRDYFAREIRRVLAENSRAIQAEFHFRSEPLRPNTIAEFDTIVGRSNSFILLFDLAARMVKEPLAAELQRAIRSFVFYMQLADDLGDWREDYRARRWTSFLRQCFGDLGRIPSESDLEQHVYFEGAYESRLKTVINGFDDLLSEVAKIPSINAFARYVQAQRLAAYEGLKSFVAVKLEHGGTYERTQQTG